MLHAAQQIALQSKHEKFRHGVVITRGGAIIARGFNAPEGGIHAEVHALSNRVGTNWSGCVVWSVRLLKSGELSMARPCDKCMKALREARVKKVIYSDWRGFLREERVS